MGVKMLLVMAVLNNPSLANFVPRVCATHFILGFIHLWHSKNLYRATQINLVAHRFSGVKIVPCPAQKAHFYALQFQINGKSPVTFIRFLSYDAALDIINALLTDYSIDLFHNQRVDEEAHAS